MKKYLLLVLLLFFPIMVHAASIELVSIEKVDSSPNAYENSTPKVEGNGIKLDVSFNDVNDFIKYKLVIKNLSSEDFILDNSKVIINNNNVKYELEDKYTIKQNESKEVFIKAVYYNEVNDTDYVDGVYNGNIVVQFNHGDQDVVLVPNTGVTSLNRYIVLLGVLLLLIILSFKYDKKLTCFILAFGLLISPIIIDAVEANIIEIDSKVTIFKEIQKRIFINGQLMRLAPDSTSVVHDDGQYNDAFTFASDNTYTYFVKYGEEDIHGFYYTMTIVIDPPTGEKRIENGPITCTDSDLDIRYNGVKLECSSTPDVGIYTNDDIDYLGEIQIK